MTKQLESKTILITGAGSGIGASLAKAFAAQGAQCILLSKTISKLEDLYDTITNNNHTPPALYPIDFAGANVDDYSQLAITIEKEFGKLDGIIHNAAIWKESTSIEHSDTKNWFESIHVNLHAPYLLTRACIPLLRKGNNAKIIFTDHTVEKNKTAHLGAFTVAKDAIKSLANLLKNELTTPNTNIGVNIVSPGDIRSPMNVRIYPGITFHNKPAPDDITGEYIHLFLKETTTSSDEIIQLDKNIQP